MVRHIKRVISQMGQKVTIIFKNGHILAMPFLLILMKQR